MTKNPAILALVLFFTGVPFSAWSLDSGGPGSCLQEPLARGSGNGSGFVIKMLVVRLKRSVHLFSASDLEARSPQSSYSPCMKKSDASFVSPEFVEQHDFLLLDLL
ncbi:MAG: hypothetical protein C5B49_15895 [Bdellovibrio sp.]|nr:MAG: hypothetical protein C5B49_15895 [Bdellovibrio sp.]